MIILRDRMKEINNGLKVVNISDQEITRINEDINKAMKESYITYKQREKISIEESKRIYIN